ncbi:MAG: hypothetical protein H0T62_12970 [Parachlamydiaceae bacterium]|nr:hypothetical protein [Parachlamydiaceae bacterium]
MFLGSRISVNPKFGSLWLSGLEALTVKVIFQSFLDRNETWNSSFLRSLCSKGQINAFIDFCLGLTKPLQTIQLHTLISQSSRDRYKEEIGKILKDRNIELVEDPN